MRNSLLIFCNHFVLRIVLILKILRISALWIQKYCIVMLFIINLSTFERLYCDATLSRQPLMKKWWTTLLLKIIMRIHYTLFFFSAGQTSRGNWCLIFGLVAIWSTVYAGYRRWVLFTGKRWTLHCITGVRRCFFLSWWQTTPYIFIVCAIGRGYGWQLWRYL